jgi:hypothetical protein
MSDTRTVERAAEPVPQSQPAGNGLGPGTPSEFTSAFADAVVAAVRQQEASTAEGHVATAIALGWYLAALAHPGDVTRTAAAARGDLAGPAEPSSTTALAFFRCHVEVAYARLEELVQRARLSLPDLEALGECIDAGKDADRRTVAAELDGGVLAVLSAVDFRLSKAYALGRGLMNLTSRPSADTTLAEHLAAERVAPIVADIDDLSSALAPHAGHSVRASLVEWRASIREGSRVAPETPETWLCLARQGELWRALLTGEKQGLHMLEIEDYVDAAERLSRRMRTVALRLVKRFPEVVVAVVVLFAAGVSLIAFTNSEAAVVAGAGSVLASLGLTWRGVGRSLGSLAGKLERPLWGAELDAAITQAITLLEREEGRDVAKERRDVAVALAGEPVQD